MESVLRKPTAFILAISLILGAFVSPIYADEAGGGTSPVYKEASTANGVDTGFERQNEIAEVKAQSCDGARTLSSDSHSGRFSLKIGKSGLTESVLCHLISSEIDLSKYNQVSMWVKPKGYNIPLTVYTQSNGQQTTVGSIEVSSLKSDTWQEISFDLSSSFGQITGLYTYAHSDKSLLIDDIQFSKTHTNSEVWDLNAGGSSNTLSSVFSYHDNLGITMKTSTASSSAYENGAKVASIENAVPGEITGIRIDSAKSELERSMIPTGGAVYIDGLVATNPALYTINENGRYLYYYDISENVLIARDYLSNETKTIYNGAVTMVTSDDSGNYLSYIDEGSNLYLIINPFDSNVTASSNQAIKISNGKIAEIHYEDKYLYYACNDNLYRANLIDPYVKEQILSGYAFENGNKADKERKIIPRGGSAYGYYLSTGKDVYGQYWFTLYKKMAQS